MSMVVSLTETALAQIRDIQAQEKKQEWGLRISVVGGGCSGMSYKLDFQPSPKQDDIVHEQGPLKIFVDPKSALFIKGLVVDYSGGLNGTGFQFTNPNASKSCGCGTSFSV